MPESYSFREYDLIVHQEMKKFDATTDISRSSVRGIGLSSHFITMKQNLNRLSVLNVQERRDKIKRLIIKDYLQEKKELRRVGLGYINTQP